MRPLRVLHVTPYSPSAWAYGGIPRVVSALTRQLVRDGHEVTICTTDVRDASSRLALPDELDGLARPRTAAWPATRQADGTETVVFPNVSNAAAYHWQAFTPVGLGSFLRERAASFDVAHLHACRNLPGVIAGRHLRRAGVPYVLAPNGTAPRLERRLAAKAVFDVLAGQRLLDGAAAVLAVTRAERQQLLRLGVADDRIHVIPNPVDLEEFEAPADAAPFRRRFSLGSDPIVLYLGKHTPRKRLDLLVEAFARVERPHAQLVIAGNDMGAGTDLRGLVATTGLAARTTFTGLLEGRDRLAALAAADVVVYPSEDEIFGLVPLEALLSGTPVIVADDSGCGEVIRSTGGGQVVPLGRAGDLAAAIDDVLSSPVHWRVEATRAAGEVRRRFAADTVTAQLSGVYGQLAGGRVAEPAPRQPEAVTHTGSAAPHGVSFVVPVRNGAQWIDDAIRSIRAQRTERNIEIIVINDGSTDDSAAKLDALASHGPLRILEGYGRGAAAAVNLGVSVARHPLIAQVDQDVILDPHWLEALAPALDDPTVAAAQGRYVTRRQASLGARVMSLDLEWRYLAMATREPDHVCTGNSIYRASAFRDVGGLDESMGYGYDNDISYRLREDGHRLAFVPEATSRHEWRQGLAGYCSQQYGLGYGRIDLVAKHPSRIGGDDVSPASMMAHPILMAVALVVGSTAMVLAWAGGRPEPWMSGSLGILVALAVERLVIGVRASLRFKDPAALLFPVFHLARDLSWVGALAAWSWHRLSGMRHLPSRSMHLRPAPGGPSTDGAVRLSIALGAEARVLGIIPSYNEAATLPSVVADLRARCPEIDVLVVDDGSTDDTAEVLESLDVRRLQFPERMGIGSAMRAGLRYAKRLGYSAAVRVDGDGQHRAGDIKRILAPLRDGRADVVLGSRYGAGGPRRPRAGAVGVVKRLLAACLSRITGSEVTDPTTGFCAFGPLAVRLLADHHPTGYPEPELRMFLTRNGLHAVEIPIRDRPRRGGQSSLTPGRLTLAGARVLLAMLIVPFRPAVTRSDGD